MIVQALESFTGMERIPLLYATLTVSRLSDLWMGYATGDLHGRCLLAILSKWLRRRCVYISESILRRYRSTGGEL